MINSIQIKNFKSVVDLSLDLGTFNVLIGENGCGKSNILEAIAFGAAASANKLDYEFLGSRGIRITNPEFMFSAFPVKINANVIRLDFYLNNEHHFYDITNDTKNNKKWIEKNLESIEHILQLVRNFNIPKEKLEMLKNKDSSNNEFKEINQKIKKIEEEMFSLIKNVKSDSQRVDISNFIIYSPEQSSLRKYEESSQIFPIGIKGEGLFRYLKELSFDNTNKITLANIKSNLTLFDWYENFDLQENLMTNEFALKINDKFLNKNLKYFDQRSTNEGFLFLLFYFTLFLSKTTPTFFAIDNIDSSLNPKLCMQLTKVLAGLATKNKKQVIITTHNPAILDGLNLKDESQRLFVIRRNDEGHTKAKRIEYKSERKMKLSEVWTKGFIGGLPENF